MAGPVPKLSMLMHFCDNSIKNVGFWTLDYHPTRFNKFHYTVNSFSSYQRWKINFHFLSNESSQGKCMKVIVLRENSHSCTKHLSNNYIITTLEQSKTNYYFQTLSSMLASNFLWSSLELILNYRFHKFKFL